MVGRIALRWVLPIAGFLTALLLCPVGHVQAYPEPSLVSDAWHLDFECQMPQTVAARDDNGQIQWYWYLVYQVENNTGEDQLFIPEVTLVTSSGLIMAADVGVPSTVFEKVKQESRNPLLERSSKVIGKILQGPDHAKDGVAIWAVPEEDVDAFTLLFSGLSGENQKIKHPITGEPVLLRKTLMVDYSTPGTLDTPQDPTIVETDRQWVMR